jgi:hypothetical protein
MDSLTPSEPIPPEWLAEFEAAGRRPLRQRWRYAFIKTYKPVMDDARFRSFDSMREYRDWCATALPSWLGYGGV